jgi:hypothetical protein
MGPHESASTRPWAILQFTRCGESAFSSRSPVGTRSRHLASQPQTTPMRTLVDVGKPFTLPISGHRKVLQTARVGSPAKLLPRMAGVICEAEEWSRRCDRRLQKEDARNPRRKLSANRTSLSNTITCQLARDWVGFFKSLPAFSVRYCE